MDAEKDAGAKYDNVHLNLNYTAGAVIDTGFFNTVKDILVDGTKLGASFHFWDTDKNVYSWSFQYPKEISKAISIGDITVDTPSGGNNQGVKLTLKEDTVKAAAAAADGEVSIVMSRPEWLNAGKIKNTLFGGSEVALKAFIEDGGAIIGLEDRIQPWCSEDEIIIHNIQELSENTGDVTYRLLLCEGDRDNEGVTKISMIPGETKSITDLLGSDAPTNATWKSLDEDVIKVENNEVEAINNGDTFLIANTSGSYKAYRIFVN